MKKRICVIGHFAKGENLLNGQTVKTKIITKELVKEFGKEQVETIDTCGGKKALIKAPFQCLSALKCSDNVIILPAENGLRIFSPLLVLFNVMFRKKLHYIVIGGWLPHFVKKKKLLSVILKKFDAIYVETYAMKQELLSCGFSNVYIIPNCKDLVILAPEELNRNMQEPYRLCTFSRVMKEKGIEEAVKAVSNINKYIGRSIVYLDIYGQVEPTQKEWFENLRNNFSTNIRYCGKVQYDRSTDILKDYYALLFPTHYAGEGFAGTLIDAMAAGVPVIASDWKYNSEVIKQGLNGFLYDLTDGSLEETILKLLNDKENWVKMKEYSLKEAQEYIPQNALRALLNLIK